MAIWGIKSAIPVNISIKIILLSSLVSIADPEFLAVLVDDAVGTLGRVSVTEPVC